jgi:hypothetical protein
MLGRINGSDIKRISFAGRYKEFLSTGDEVVVPHRQSAGLSPLAGHHVHLGGSSLETNSG